ncbi:MAG: CAAX prenyl protease-related protein [Kiritimatiellae bacterium]|nr:CAAX prenyl protease-related protein [Kiritimatiellia bacterium]
MVTGRKGSFWLIAPYAAWMALMAALPDAPVWYAVRTVAVMWLLVVAGWRLSMLRLSVHRRNVAAGAAVGLAVFAVWVLPEQFDWGWYRRFCIVGEGGTSNIAESRCCWIAFRLVGSAFVISVAEELFFRKWLIGFAGFWWSVALFAVEHDRWLVGAIAGAVYGALYLRRGLGAAIAAHATTNLALGFWVLLGGQWQFW